MADGEIYVGVIKMLPRSRKGSMEGDRSVLLEDGRLSVIGRVRYPLGCVGCYIQVVGVP